MNIENLKNMPIVGEEPGPVPVLEDAPAPPSSEMQQLAIAVRTFQTELGARSSQHVADSIARRDEVDAQAATAAAAHWASQTSAFNTLHVERVAEIDDLTASFASRTATLLGIEGQTAAEPATVFGLIESLVQENATWESLLAADVARANERFDQFQSDIVDDIDNPLNDEDGNPLNFTGAVQIKAGGDPAALGLLAAASVEVVEGEE